MGLLGQRPAYIATRLNGVHMGQALLGVPIPILMGQRRIGGKLLWYGDFTSKKAQQPGGSGLAKGGTEYVYSASVILGLCQGVCANLLSVWDSTGKFVVDSTSETYTVTGGSPSYTVSEAALFTQDQGVGYASAYSVGVNDYGSPGPVTLSGTQQIPMALVSSAPGSGQYTVDPTTGTYGFSSSDSGKEVTITYTFYRYANIVEQLSVVPFVGPYVVTVDNQPYFGVDEGVEYYPSGIPLTKVSGTPSTGQYNPNGGNYTFAAGDAGQGVTINYSYNNPNVDNNAPNRLNFTFFEGAQGQSPWSYLTTKHPGEALGYTQLAFIGSIGLYLGYSPEIPAYSYEILGPYAFGSGIPDCCPSDCIEAILSDPIIGIGFPSAYIASSLQGVSRNFWLANNFFISPYLDTQRSVSSVVGEWCEAGQVANFWSEGLMKFIPYGTTSAIANGAQFTPPTTPVYSFTDSDYITDGTEAPIKVSRSAWQDAYNKVEVQWSVRTNDYNTDVCPEQDDAAIQMFGLRLEPPKSYDFICTLPAAQFAANMRVQRNVHIRNTYSFRVPSNFIWLDPMDVIEVSDSILGLSQTAVRIIKMLDDPQKGITLTCEDFPWATGNPSLYPKQPTVPSSILSLGQQAPGNTNLLVLELPDRLGFYQGDILYLFASGNTPNWGGCVVWKALGTDICFITNVSASGGTLTVTGNNAGTSPVQAGDIVTFFNLSGAAAVLNGESVTVATATSSGFTASYSSTISSTATSGFASAMSGFAVLGQVTTSARMGVLSAGLAAYSGTNPDTTDTLAVTMNEPSATLASVSAATAAQSFPATLSAIITAAPVESAGPDIATAGQDNGGPNAWSNPGNVGSTSSYATVSIPHSAGSNVLQASGFFASNPLPAGATLTGIAVNFNGYCGWFPTGGSPGNCTVQLGQSGSAIGTAETIDTYGTSPHGNSAGGPTSLWGLSSAPTLTSLDVLIYMFDGSLSGSTTGEINDVTVTVYYTLSAPAAEFLSYETATLTSAGTPPGGPSYDLTTLYRGLMDSDAAAHLTGDVFVRLDDASLTYQYDPSLVRQYIFLAATSFNSYGNQQQEISEVTIVPVLLQGTGPGTTNLSVGFLQTHVGTIPPIFSGSLSYSSTTTSITWSWTSLAIYRPDGTTTSIPNGSVVVTDLTANTTYYFYPYYDETNEIINFVAGGVGNSALGAIAQTAKSNVALQGQTMSGFAPLSIGAMSAATPSSGSGGGSGGGTGVCLKSTAVVKERTKGVVPIARCAVGDWLDGPDGWTQITRMAIVPNEIFIMAKVDTGDGVMVTPTHPFQTVTENGEEADCCAKDLTLSHLLKLRGGKISPVRHVSVIRDPGGKKAVVTCEPSRLFYAGQLNPNIVTHNVVPTS